jgi:vancomycin resistance protein YoaR
MLAAAQTDRRVLELPVTVLKPAVPMEERHALGIKELVERSSTSFAGSVPAKRHNIRVAAERIAGAVVPPGGTFSFNQAVGPTTLEAGFQWGFAIQGGANGAPKTIPSVAGGICQVATTLFHSVFWAGYPIEERYPHLYWIPAYTSKGVEGIDTTVDEAAGLDFRFVNPLDTHLLVEAWVDSSDRLNFALYGTKPTWSVKVEGPLKTSIRPHDPTPIEEDDPTAPYPRRTVVEAARDGFDMRLIRKVTHEGDTRTLTLVSHYQPSRNVTLVGSIGRPKPTPVPTPQAEAPNGTPGPRATPAATPRAGAQPAPQASAAPASQPPPPAATP